jgi:hypothetical protein
LFRNEHRAGRDDVDRGVPDERRAAVVPDRLHPLRGRRRASTLRPVFRRARRGLDNRHRMYQGWFAFVERVLGAGE